VPTPEDDDSTEAAAAAESEGGDGASAEDAVEDELEIHDPPALIVHERAPERATSRTIGVAAREHAGPGVEVTFAISPGGRRAERAALNRPERVHPGRNVLALPYPRLELHVTRVATTASPDDDRS